MERREKECKSLCGDGGEASQPLYGILHAPPALNHPVQPRALACTSNPQPSNQIRQHAPGVLQGQKGYKELALSILFVLYGSHLVSSGTETKMLAGIRASTN